MAYQSATNVNSFVLPIVNILYVCLLQYAWHTELHNNEGHALYWIRFSSQTILVDMFELYLARRCKIKLKNILFIATGSGNPVTKIWDVEW
jgi:hypothetical protein